MRDSAVDEGQWSETPKPIDHMHVAKIFQHQLNWFYFVNFLHMAFLEPIHAFLSDEGSTIRSRRVESDFLGITF